MASNRIGGANIGRYDAQHLRVTQRQVQHVAPHVLRDLKAKYELDLEDLDVEEFLALLTQDELQLSEEAMDILKKFKKRKKKRGRGRHQDDSEEAFLELLEQLEEQQVHPPMELPGVNAPQPFLPPVIQLSNYSPAVEQNRPKPTPSSTQDEEDDYLRLSRAGRIAMAPPQNIVRQIAAEIFMLIPVPFQKEVN